VEIENVMTDNLGVCATACDENPGCNSFSFYAPSRGCHLKVGKTLRKSREAKGHPSWTHPSVACMHIKDIHI